MSNDTKTFQAQALEAIEGAALALLRKGDWLTLGSYRDRVDALPFVRRAWEGIDREALLEKVTDGIEDRIAHQICAHMTQEIGTDVKKVMSDQDLRAELRAIVKLKLRERGAL